MNVAVAKPMLSDDEVGRIVQKVINRLFLRKWAAYAKDGWKKDAELMAGQQTQEGGGRMKLIRALTPQQYEMLSLMKPDGNKNWNLNTEFLKFLEKTDEFGFLKQNKLNSVDPAELGHKEALK